MRPGWQRWTGDRWAGYWGALDTLDPSHALSGHLPVAHQLDTLTDIVRGAYGRGTTDAVTPPTAAQVEAILA